MGGVYVVDYVDNEKINRTINPDCSSLSNVTMCHLFWYTPFLAYFFLYTPITQFLFVSNFLNTLVKGSKSINTNIKHPGRG